MRKPTTITLSSLHKLFRRTITTTTQPPPLPPTPLRGLFHLSPTNHFPIRLFSNKVSNFTSPNQELNQENENNTVSLLSTEITKNSDAEPLQLSKRLDLSFSHIELTHDLILTILNVSPDAGRMVLDFLKWVEKRPNFEPTDEFYSHFVHYFGRRKDFKAINEVLGIGRGVIGTKCFEGLVERLVRAGRATQAVSLFETMEKEFGFVRDIDSLKFIVSSLCRYGYASCAEKMVKGLANEFFPDEFVCDRLVEGWCVDGKFDEAKRLVGEMYRGGFEVGVGAYNAMLECVCKLCREKDPFRLRDEAENVLVEMERNGVPRNVETFNVLISNLCKIRRTSDAMDVFGKMGEWGCYPNETTFLVLIKSLYQAARVGEGDEMIDRMKSAGYGDALDKKAYYEFLKILCGIERIDHAMSVFAKMKEDGCGPGIKTYDLLMGKLCAHGRVDKANALYKEAESNGITVEPKEYKIDPRFVKKKTVEKKEKKRETLPEKMARKRKKLRKIRLSFVKKPKKMRRY